MPDACGPGQPSEGLDDFRAASPNGLVEGITKKVSIRRHPARINRMMLKPSSQIPLRPLPAKDSFGVLGTV